MQKIGWLLVLLAMGAVTSEALADGMRCGSRLISTGDTLYQVRSVCGEPDDARQRVVTRTERRRVSGACAHARCTRTEEYTVDVVIDEWTYDLGRQRFVRYLTFVDGRLDQVGTGGYGSN